MALEIPWKVNSFLWLGQNQTTPSVPVMSNTIFSLIIEMSVKILFPSIHEEFLNDSLKEHNNVIPLQGIISGVIYLHNGVLFSAAVRLVFTFGE